MTRIAMTIAARRALRYLSPCDELDVTVGIWDVCPGEEESVRDDGED